MKISVLAVGKVRETFYTQAVDEYMKRLSRYCRPEILEVADEKTPDGASAGQEELIKNREGARLEKLIRPDAHVIALDIQGTELASEELAARIEQLGVQGTSHIQFVIGGSLGLSRRVLDRADERLSFSKMTFPHQLMRVILLEQIYRSYKIINHEPYHK